jgi:anti-sigma factor RsiW
MICTDCTALLHEYVDGELAVRDARAVEAHVTHCAGCRAGLESLRTLLASAAVLPKEIAPQRDLWREIELEVERVDPDAFSGRAPARQANGVGASHSTVQAVILRWLAPVAIAASVVFLATFAERGIALPDDRPAWSVTTVAGAPRVDAKTIEREAKLRVGQWLETDNASRATVTVGNIGEVTVDSNSRLRLVSMAATDHRLELKQGTMSAQIYAPPRLFFVNTPYATAVDYGCSYTLTVDAKGNGELHVSTGYVALEHRGRGSIIPMGMKCLTRRGTGPGTPFADDAPDALRAALARFDFERGAAPAALRVILDQARTEDAVTLWHLLDRTVDAQRAEVFDGLAKVTPVPAGVTRAGILSGDTVMLRTWGAALGLNPR